jgi:hypothetical protein
VVDQASRRPAGLLLSWRGGEGQPTPDGCVVLTPAEVSAASGFEIVETMPIFTGQPGCGWFDRDGMVMSARFHARETGQSHWDAEVGRGEIQAIDGIGDDAIWIERGWQLWVWKGEMLVMMGIGRIGETPQRFELAMRLAPVLIAKVG